MNPAECIAGTKVRIIGDPIFGDIEIGTIVTSGVHEDTRNTQLAEVSIDSGALEGRRFSIALSYLEVIE